MSAGLRGDLVAAALGALLIHGLVAMLPAGPPPFSAPESSHADKRLELSLVSTYRGTETVRRTTDVVAPVAPSPPVRREPEIPEKRETPLVEKKVGKNISNAPLPEQAVVADGVTGGSDDTPGPVVTGDLKGPVERDVTEIPPRYRRAPAPPYPEASRRRGQEGVVVLSVEVLADGSVGHVEVRRSSEHASLDDAALRAVREWVFEPARAGGEPVARWVEIPLRFTLRDAEKP